MNEKGNETEEDEVFRSAAISGWIQTKMERDKSLLYLSSGAIGLLVSFLQFPTKIDSSSSIFYYIAFGFFLICIACVLRIFGQNAEYIESELTEKEYKNEKQLKYTDYVAIGSFVIGILFTILIGIRSLI